MEVTLEERKRLETRYYLSSFNPYSNGSYSGSCLFGLLCKLDTSRFNPYSNGSYSGSIMVSRSTGRRFRSFNPYSNGSYSGRKILGRSCLRRPRVSILILMEVTLEASVLSTYAPNNLRFNPYSNGSYSGRP